MQDFLIEVFRKFTTNEKPCLKECELYAFVKKHVSHLIRRNGQCYDPAVDDIDKTISGTLFGSKFFEKDTNQGTWAINFGKADLWQKAMLDCINQKQPWLYKEIGGEPNAQATNMSYLNKVNIYTQKPKPVRVTPTKNYASLAHMHSTL